MLKANAFPIVCIVAAVVLAVARVEWWGVLVLLAALTASTPGPGYGR